MEFDTDAKDGGRYILSLVICDVRHMTYLFG